MSPEVPSGRHGERRPTAPTENHEERIRTTMNDAPAPLTSAHVVTKLPAQDLDRARRSSDVLGLEPVEERGGGLRYLCGATEFICSRPQGRRRGPTQAGFEVDDIDASSPTCALAAWSSNASTSPASRSKATSSSCRTTIRARAPASAAPSSATARATCCRSDSRPADNGPAPERSAYPGLGIRRCRAHRGLGAGLLEGVGALQRVSVHRERERGPAGERLAGADHHRRPFRWPMWLGASG